MSIIVRHERQSEPQGSFWRETAQPMRDKAPRDLLAGAGHKSPSAAVVKSHGGEHRRKRPGMNRVR